MTKKLLAILISVVLVVSCMMVPAMAEDLSWTLDSEAATTIEGEWFFNGLNANPGTIDNYIKGGSSANANRYWVGNDSASNKYTWYEGWKGADHSVTFTVNSTVARNYAIEFVCSDKDDFSDISVYVGPAFVAGTKTSTGTEVYRIGATINKKYENASVPLAQGANTIRIDLAKKTNRNAYYFDYIKFTPVGEELPLAVIGVEDNTVDATCLSVVFNKPITSAEGIVVTAQDGSTAAITTDANKAIIKNVAGKTTITVPAGFTGGNAQGTEVAYEETVFAYPLINTAGKSYPTTAYSLSVPAENKVGGFAGAEKVGMKAVQWQPVIAVYDGDKLVDSKVGSKVEGAWNGSISLILDEGVKFTEVKIFAWWNVGDEWIPLGPSTSATAESLGFEFE